jgi:hypothetical protein
MRRRGLELGSDVGALTLLKEVENLPDQSGIFEELVRIAAGRPKRASRTPIVDFFVSPSNWVLDSIHAVEDTATGILRSKLGSRKLRVLFTRRNGTWVVDGWNTSSEGSRGQASENELEVETAKSTCELYAIAMLRWHAIRGEYPKDLRELLTPPAHGRRPLLSQVLRDPWGQPYRIQRLPNRIYVHSTGPDREAETADDIRSSPLFPD